MRTKNHGHGIVSSAQFWSKKLLFFLILVASFIPEVKAQTPAAPVISFGWNTYVGCTEGSNPDRKTYEELIADNECLNSCKGSTVSYYVSSNPINSAATWYVSGGTIISQSAFGCTVLWGSSSSGSISVDVTTGGVVYPLAALCVTLITSPIAAFTLAPNTTMPRPEPEFYEVCSDQDISFTNLSTANGGTGIFSYHWNFGDPASGTSNDSYDVNPIHNFDNDGTYTVTLTVTNQCFCSSTYIKKIRVGKKGIKISCASTVCQGQTATYSVPDDLRRQCEEFNWSVVGGEIISREPYTNQIEVLWDTRNPEEIAGGFGYVTFDPSGCRLDCYEPSTIQIPIILNHGTITGDAVICPSGQQLYTLPQWPTTDYQWSVINDGNTNATTVITDQRNRIIVAPGDNPGIVTLRCTYQNTLLNCGGTATFQITIKAFPEIDGPTAACIGTPVSYTVAGGVSATWQARKLPSGPSINYTGVTFTPNITTAGNYSITTSGNNLCMPGVIYLKVAPIPATPVISGPNTVCPASPMTFSVASAPETYTTWTVSGGTVPGAVAGSPITGDAISVIFNYPFSGTYSVTAVTRSTIATACVSASTVKILTLPIVSTVIKGATITTNPNILPCSSSFQNYTALHAGADNYVWTIDPPTAGSIISGNGTQSVQVLWNEASGTAELKVKIQSCTIDTNAELDVTIGNPPIAITALPTTICSGTSQSFSISSATPLNSSTGTITWDFGDGYTQVGTGPNGAATHTYNLTSNTPASFPISVTILTPNGCTNTSIVNAPTALEVLPKPVAAVTPANVHGACLFSDFTLADRTLTATMSSGYGAITSIQWYANNVAISGQTTSTLVVTSAMTTAGGFGNYYAIVSNGTCSARTNTVQYVITGCNPPCVIVPDPNLDVTVATNCGATTATATFIGSPVISWSGTPTNITGNTATYNYTTAGNYYITCSATYTVSGEPCVVSKSKNVLIPYIPDMQYEYSCANGSYELRIMDSSNFTPGTPITTWAFTLDGAALPQGSSPINERVATLAPGSVHTITMTIGDGGLHPNCTKSLTITVPTLPNANFTFPSGPYCVNNPIAFNVPTQPGCTYLWDFSGPFSNTQQNPTATFANTGLQVVTLYVTNAYNCTVSFQRSFTTVTQNFVGGIDPLIGEGCAGGSGVILTYVPDFDSDVASSYQWMNDGFMIPGANSVSYTATTAGSYWLKVSNSTTCSADIYQKVPVTFLAPPSVTISGLPNACEGSPVLLNALATGSNLLYSWTRNGSSTILSTTAQLYDYPPGVGNYTYTVVVKQPISGGQFCTSTATYNVTVTQSPIIQNLYFDNLVCAPYSVEVHATADIPGYFTWSNGMNGSDITVTQGGPLQVTFTSLGGCSTSAQIAVPKNLEPYLWIVPKGCYTFCEKFETGSLLGPQIASFEGWDWLQDTTPVLTGIQNVDTYIVPDGTGSSDYALHLNDSGCDVVSDPVSITVLRCTCKIDATIQEITTLTTPFLAYRIRMFIANTTFSPMVVTVTADNHTGVFVPSVVSVPPGGATFTFTLIPDNDFFGGNAMFTLSSTNREGQNCIEKLSPELPPLPTGESSKGLNSGNSLKLVPNPAKDHVDIAYVITTLNGSETIELYDGLGRLLDAFGPKNSTGMQRFNLLRYAAGVYVVIMKQDGAIIQQKNLIVSP